MGAICTAWNPTTYENQVSDGANQWANLPVLRPTLMTTGRVTLISTPGLPIILGPLYTAAGSSPPPPPASGGDPGGGGSVDPLGAAAMLARATVVVLSGTRDTTYEVASPAAQTTYDLRLAEFVSYHDKDAVYETNSFAGGSTTHQKNHRPIRLGYTTPATELALVGGLVRGDQPENLTWVRMKYGQNIQDDTDDWVDAGRPGGVDPYENIVNNDNQDGDPRIYLASGTWAVVDGLRVRNTHDGFGLFGINTAGDDGAGTVQMRNCWFQDIHDDGVENDDWQTLYVEDCLFDRVYSLVSTRPSTAGLTGSPGSAKTVRIEDCVVHLAPFPGGHKQRSTAATHGTILKIDANSPPHEIVRTVIRVDGPFIDSGAAQLPVRPGDMYQDVTIVWAGGGAYPGNVPAGCTLTTDTSLHDTAVALWKSSHGVTDFFNVDYALFLLPGPL